MHHIGNYPGVESLTEERDWLFGEMGIFGTVDKDDVVGDSYILRGLNGKVRVEDLVVGVDSKKGLNEKYCNGRREGEGNQKVGKVQNWELVGLVVEHEGVHSQNHMGMKMKVCCDCPYDVVKQYSSIRVLHMHVNWYRVLQYTYELVDKFLCHKQNYIPEKMWFLCNKHKACASSGRNFTRTVDNQTGEWGIPDVNFL